jgi:GNAT superfamily N-acetyltransferase
VQTTREDGYQIDTSTQRLDLALVHHWLANDSYWAKGRSADVVARSVHNSLCFGVYTPDRRQVGFARAVTDHATFAWLCDVYIAPDSRALGLGTWLARVTVDHIRAAGIPRLLLATHDAHTVYEKAGFTGLAVPERWMEIDLRGV